MVIQINMKGVSNRENKIKHLTYDYEKSRYTLQEFLAETVLLTVKDYNEKLAGKLDSSKEYYERSEDSSKLLQCLTTRQIDDMAEFGKVSFGILYGDEKPDQEEAINNAVQCFKDGMVAVFINGERYEELEQEITLKEKDEVTFVRLTFLAGRMW